MSNEKGTTVYALQKKFQSIFGFTLPLFHGRGLLNCTLNLPWSILSFRENSTTVCFVCCVDNLGLMPYRKRIVAVSTFLVFPFLFILSFFDGWPDLVGRPIHVEQSDKPTLEELTRIQKLYIDELTR